MTFILTFNNLGAAVKNFVPAGTSVYIRVCFAYQKNWKSANVFVEELACYVSQDLFINISAQEPAEFVVLGLHLL